MAIDELQLGQGNTLPYYLFEVRDKDGAVSLSDVQSVIYRMAKLVTGSQGSVIAGSVVVSAYAFITDALNGEGEYRWGVGDTDEIGEYVVSFTFNTESSQTYSLPRNMIAKVTIEDSFATRP